MLPLIVAAVGGLALYKFLTKKSDEKPPQRQRLSDPAIVVLGRTGAGKSTLINWLTNSDQLAVGDVASTTREIATVKATVDGRSILFVDTPGIGEVSTHTGYRDQLLSWCSSHHEDIRLCLMLLQADAKAHVEELDLLNRMAAVMPGLQTRIVLSQVDKMKPVRKSLPGSTWEDAITAGGLKVDHIREKINLTASQFDCPREHVLPISSIEAFNKGTIVSHVMDILLRQHCFSAADICSSCGCSRSAIAAHSWECR